MHQEPFNALATANGEVRAPAASAGAATAGSTPNVAAPVGWADRFGAVRRRAKVSTVLLVGDMVAIAAATLVCQATMKVAFHPAEAVSHLSAFWLLVLYIGLGLYASSGPSPFERFRLRAIGIVLFLATDVLLAPDAKLDLHRPLFALSIGASLLAFGHYAELAARRFLIRKGLWGAPTVLIGCDEKNDDLARKLMNEPELGLHPVGFLVTPEDTGQSAARVSLPVLGTVRDAARLCRSIEVVVFTSTRHLHEAVKRDSPQFTHVYVVEDAQDMQSLWLRTRTLCGAVGIEIRRDLYLRQNLWAKRAVDLAIAIPAGLVCLPLILLLALAVKLVDPGPAFYVQMRVGRGGRPLPVYKLRSMRCDGERRLEEYLSTNAAARAEWSQYFKLENDPRILPGIGSVLRRSSLDELPQLWNIIRGDMSVVGPRPFPRYHTSNFDREFQAVRESVPPGLTGLWQVSARSDGNLAVQRAQDLFYIRNWSVWLDLYIILQTVPAVLSGRGAK